MDAYGAKDFAPIGVVRQVMGRVFECEETKPRIEYNFGNGLDRSVCRDVYFLVHVGEREAGDLVDLVTINGSVICEPASGAAFLRKLGVKMIAPEKTGTSTISPSSSPGDCPKKSECTTSLSPSEFPGSPEWMKLST